MEIQEEMKEYRCEQMGVKMDRITQGDRAGQWDYHDRSNGKNTSKSSWSSLYWIGLDWIGSKIIP